MDPPSSSQHIVDLNPPIRFRQFVFKRDYLPTPWTFIDLKNHITYHHISTLNGSKVIHLLRFYYRIHQINRISFKEFMRINITNETITWNSHKHRSLISIPLSNRIQMLIHFFIGQFPAIILPYSTWHLTFKHIYLPDYTWQSLITFFVERHN